MSDLPTQTRLKMSEEKGEFIAKWQIWHIPVREFDNGGQTHHTGTLCQCVSLLVEI